uniref:Uncharacterized protein n=1 Tax=viral metagenome TaxID=1070528 RepID=A0A2V0RAM2_9ZZZZ
MWDSDLWTEYCSYRRGLEHGGNDAQNELEIQSLTFGKVPFRVLMIDQDVFDTWNNHFGVIQWFAHRQIHTFSTASAVLDKDFNVDYQGTVNTTGSGGGVASGSTFDQSDLESVSAPDES